MYTPVAREERFWAANIAAALCGYQRVSRHQNGDVRLSRYAGNVFTPCGHVDNPTRAWNVATLVSRYPFGHKHIIRWRLVWSNVWASLRQRMSPCGGACVEVDICDEAWLDTERVACKGTHVRSQSLYIAVSTCICASRGWRIMTERLLTFSVLCCAFSLFHRR